MNATRTSSTATSTIGPNRARAGDGVRRTLLWALAIGAFALLTQWIVWLRQDRAEEPSFIGPPRSDYVLEDFTLTALNGAGALSFEGSAPRLSRHPFAGTLAIERPDFALHSEGGDVWKAVAERATVNADGDELTLTERASIARVPSATARPLTLAGEALTFRVNENRVLSDDPVTITSPGSILSGRGLDADLNAERVSILSRVRLRYEPLEVPSR